MSTDIALGSEFVQQLIGAGLLPRLCTRFEFECVPAKPIRFRYEVLATKEQCEKFAQLMIDNASEAEPWLREAVAKDPLFPKREANV